MDTGSWSGVEEDKVVEVWGGPFAGGEEYEEGLEFARNPLW